MEPTQANIRKLDNQTGTSIEANSLYADMSKIMKQLIENSLDANSTSIKISYCETGKIIVADNGSGIKEEDFPYVGKKNYTSKIKNPEDLQNLSTFGSSGHSLNLLFDIAKVSIHTRHGEENGTYIEWDRKAEISKKNLKKRTIGTTVTVEDIFVYYVPRQNLFFQNIKKEIKKIVKLFKTFFFSTDKVDWTLCELDPKNKNGKEKTIYSCTDKKLESKIQYIFPNMTSEKVIQIKKTEELDVEDIEEFLPIEIDGYISKAQKNLQVVYDKYFFFNGREIKSRQLSSLIFNIFNNCFETSKNFFLILRIMVPNEKIKNELRKNLNNNLFTYHEYIFEVIEKSIMKLYEDNTKIIQNLNTVYTEKQIETKKNKNRETKSNTSKNLDKPSSFQPNEIDIAKEDTPISFDLKDINMLISERKSTIFKLNKFKSTPMEIEEIISEDKDNTSTQTIQSILDTEVVDKLKILFRKEDFSRLKPIAHFNKSFIISKLGEDLFISDQHAIDESLKFEDFLKKADPQDNIKVVNKIIQVDWETKNTIINNQSIFLKFGFKFDIKLEASDHKITMLNVPTGHKWIGDEEDVIEIAKAIDDCLLSNFKLQKMIEATKKEACKAAIKFKTSMTKEQMEDILQRAAKSDYPWA